MKIFRAGLLALAVGAFVGADAFAQRGGRFGQSPRGLAQNGWLSSLRDAKERAKKSGKPLMVVLRCVP